MSRLVSSSLYLVRGCADLHWDLRSVVEMSRTFWLTCFRMAVVALVILASFASIGLWCVALGKGDSLRRQRRDSQDVAYPFDCFRLLCNERFRLAVAAGSNPNS